MAVYSCGRSLTQILEMRMISHLFSYQSLARSGIGLCFHVPAAAHLIVSSQMTNIFSSTEPVDFWVWVNPNNWLVRHQISVVGGFFSGGLVSGENKSNLMFLPNPDFGGDITPFQHGVMREYMAEYNLEMGREFYNFKDYPSRLNALYLFDREAEAHKYKARHMAHVDGRVLKKGKSVTQCIYSKHDSSWVDFLRLTHSVDPESIANVSKSYWSGVNVKDCQLMSMGQPWSQEPIIEILFLGRIEFYDKNLDC